MKARTLTHFLERYRGVEGFYFINRKADLGYIRAADAKPVKETFPQLHDRHFIRRHPNTVQQLEIFLRDLLELSYIYLNSAETGMELGFVLPVSESNRQWRSASLVVHQSVLETTQKDYNEILENRKLDAPTTAAPFTEAQHRIGRKHSAYRGLQLLMDHRNCHGEYRYFPVLFFHSGAGVAETQLKHEDPSASGLQETGLRIINLLWHRPKGHDAITPRHNVIFDILRQNLEERGVLERGMRASLGTDNANRTALSKNREALTH